MSQHGWIGVDLDGTLAQYNGWTGSPYDIGDPVPLMLSRVKQWLKEGKDVRIFTARVSPRIGTDEEKMREELENVRVAIENWCFNHVGRALPITYKKDYAMIELWDDRAVQVVPNTGERVDGVR